MRLEKILIVAAVILTYQICLHGYQCYCPTALFM